MLRRVLAVVVRGAASTEEADQPVPGGCYEEFWTVVERGAASTEEVTRAAPPLFARCGGATSRSADQLVPDGYYEEFWQLWCAARPAQRRSQGLLHHFLRAVVVQRLGVLTNWFLMDVTKSSGSCGARRGQHRGGHSGCSTTFCALLWCNVSEC